MPCSPPHADSELGRVNLMRWISSIIVKARVAGWVCYAGGRAWRSCMTDDVHHVCAPAMRVAFRVSPCHERVNDNNKVKIIGQLCGTILRIARTGKRQGVSDACVHDVVCEGVIFRVPRACLIKFRTTENLKTSHEATETTSKLGIS